MKQCLLLLISSLCLTTGAHAQETSNFSLNFEFGFHDVTTSLKDEWNIRQDVSSGFYDDYNLRVYPSLQANQLALKPEWYFFDQKLAFETGLKYTYLNSELDMGMMPNDLPAYFFLRYESSGINTHYAKVHSVTETTHYIGVPLQIKLIPYKWNKFDFFISTGIDVGIRLNTNTKINFVNDNMNEFHDQILDAVGIEVNRYYSTWENAIGFSYKDNTLFNYRFELLLPSYQLTKNNSSLVNGNRYTGFRLSLQLPIN